MSNLFQVKSGVPHWSVLGPLLFIIFINDVDDEISGMILKFADDTKVLGIGGTENDIDKLKNGFKSLFSWSLEWKLVFNVEKCKVSHFGHGNKKFSYEMGGVLLESVDEECDLGVIVQKSLKVDKQCANLFKSANGVLGMIRKLFVNKHKEIILPQYK